MKESAIFSILLQLEEQQKRYIDRIAELKPYKMAGRAKNLVWLLECEVKETGRIISYLRETISN